MGIIISHAILKVGINQRLLKEHENRTVQEYRINGRLYKVRITPSVGAPYYLVDQDGSGDLSWHSCSGPAVTQVPQWVLMRW